MKKGVLLAAFALLIMAAGCRKHSFSGNLSTSKETTSASSFVPYIIPKGQHYATANPFKATELTDLKFTVRFDSSCIYRSADPQNQWDINKLYGFADNSSLHQQYSARVGWRWSDSALRLFAYTYNNSVRDEKEITTIGIGQEVSCAIGVREGRYIFVAGGKSVIMPRFSTGPTAKGYQLYPYFGGDEPAPHTVTIWIREDKP